MRLKLLLSLAAAVCVLAISSTAFGKPAPAVDGRVSAVQPVQKEASSTIPSSAYPNGGVELLRTGDPLDYISLVVEQDSTTGELLQRLRVEQHTGTYACRDIPDVEDERCCSESLSQKLRLHRIQANAFFDSQQVALHGTSIITVDQGGTPMPQSAALFGGQELHSLVPYNWQYLDLATALDDTELEFENDGCLGVGCADFEKTVSNHDVDALIALGGQDLNLLLLEKGIPEGRVAGIVDGLRDIVDSPLWPYRYWVDIDASGIVHLNYPAYQQGLIFYEQIEAGSDKNSPDYDYADASYWFWVMCGDLTEETIAPPQEVVIRDSITTDPAYTSWNGHFGVTWYSGQPRVLAFEVFSEEEVSLKELQAVIVNSAPPGTQLVWSQFDYRIYAWEDWATAFANPTQGTIGTYVIPELLEPQQVWGQTQTNFGPRDTYRIRVDASSTGVTIPAGGSRIIGFSIAAGSSSGTPNLCESDEISDVDDYRYSGSFWTTTFDAPGRLVDGRLGVKVITETN